MQWVPSGYLLTYGGFMLLGGRAADLLGGRGVLISGTVLIGIARPFSVLGFTIAGGRIVEIDVLADPERLRAIDLTMLDD